MTRNNHVSHVACGAAATLAILAAVLGGCTASPHAGFEKVESSIYEQTGHRVTWYAGGAEDQAADRAISGLLTPKMTAEQAVQVALLKNADIQATYEDLGIAQADLVQAGLLANPVISAQMRFPARPHFPVEVNVEEEFLQLFFVPLKKKIAEASFEQARATVTAAVIRRASEVRVAFYTLEGAEAIVETRSRELQAAEATLDASRRLRVAGNIRELDYANDQGKVADARLALSQAEETAADAREDLTRLMGLWGAEAAAWGVDGQFADPPAAIVPLQGLESQAVGRREELLAARSAVMAAAQTAGMANMAAFFSGATVGADYVRDPDVKSTVGPAISVPVPIFDQGQASVARAGGQLRQVQDRYAALAVQIRSEVRRTYARMDHAAQRAAYYKDELVPLRQRIVNETQLQYNGMQVGVSVLLQSKQDEIRAEEGHAEALRDYWVARSQLEAAVGGKLPEATPSASTAPATAPLEKMPRTPASSMPAMPGMGLMPGM